MIHEALLVAHKHSELQQKEAEYIEDLKKLPIEELKLVVETGEVKLAFGMPMGDGSTGSWLDHFKGTPFFEQAIGLEQEELQAQMAQQQQQTVDRQKNQQGWDQMDQIRLKKRLLELQKARNEAQVLSGGGGPPNQTGSGAGPGAEAQGAGALGPVASEGQQDGMGDAHKLGSIKTAGALRAAAHNAVAPALLLGGLGALATQRKSKPESEHFSDRHPKVNATLRMGAVGAALGGGSTLARISHDHPGVITREIKHLARTTKNKGKSAITHAKDTIKANLLTGEGKRRAEEGADKMLGMMKKKSSVDADAFGRMLARQDMAKVAKAQSLQSAGDEVGRLMAKTAVSAEWVGKHALSGIAKRKGLSSGRVESLSGYGAAVGRLNDTLGSGLSQSSKLNIKKNMVDGAKKEFGLGKEGGVLGEVSKWALEHPHQAGAVAGGTLGAAHGLLRENGGVGEAVAEGAVGAGLGHAAGGIAGGMRSIEGTAGQKLQGSAKMYGAHMKNEAVRLSDKLKSSLGGAKPPEASLGGPQVQKLD